MAAEPVADFYVVQGEAKVDMSPILRDSLGVPINLTGTTTTLTLKADGATTVLVTNGACVNDPDQVTNTGRTTYTFLAGDLINALGYYVGRFKVTFPSGVVRRVPTVPFRLYAYQREET